MIIIEQKLTRDEVRAAEAVEAAEFASRETELWGNKFPTRDFGASDRKGFRTTEDFDSSFGVRS